MSKTISKALLDEAIEQTRHYYDFDVPQAEKDVCAFMRATQAAYGGEYSIIMNDFLSSILSLSGLKPDASNEDVYKVLEVLGWTVK